MRTLILTAFAVAMLLFTNAEAVVIEYELTDLGGDQFRYDYTVTNDGSITDNLELFGINFDPGLYDEFSLLPSLSGDAFDNWDGQILGSAIGLPAVFDLFAFGGGLEVGDVLTGVGIQFSYLGDDLPGVQGFEVFDSFTFDFLGDGSTTLAQMDDPMEVPAPATLLLMGLGLALVGAKRYR